MHARPALTASYEFSRETTSREGIRQTPLPDLLGQNACLNTLGLEQNSFTVTLAATMEREFPFQD